MEINKKSIESIASILDEHDSYSATHQQRAAKLAQAIATELKLSEKEIEEIYLGGLIHDVGKSAIETSLLNKPGALKKEEFEEVKKHCRAGVELVKDKNLPDSIVSMILQHHEHIDGSGYPDGLKGNEISLPARIMAVCDVVEAITFERPYRRSFGIRQALQHIQA